MSNWVGQLCQKWTHPNPYFDQIVCYLLKELCSGIGRCPDQFSDNFHTKCKINTGYTIHCFWYQCQNNHLAIIEELYYFFLAPEIMSHQIFLEEMVFRDLSKEFDHEWKLVF